MKNIATIILSLITINLWSQDCYIDLYFPPAAFKHHKVKEVKVSMIEKDSVKGLHQFTYQVSSKDIFYRSLRNSAQGYLETNCTWTKDSLRKTITTTSFDIYGNVFPVKRVIKEFDKKRRMIIYSDEELMGNYVRHITRFNFDDTTETYIETIAMIEKDTIAQSINRQNSKGFLMIARTKDKGVSTVKKQYVTYENGKVVQFDEYENGKLISTRKGHADEDALLRKAVDPESLNALPYTDYSYNDTLKVDVSELPAFYRKALGKNFKEKKLIKVIHYYRPDHKDIYGVNYHYINGLPLISHAWVLNTFMLYEYTFYKPAGK